MKTALLNFYALHSGVLRNTYTEVSLHFQHDPLHNLRLSVKRMRVFFGFLATWDETMLRQALPFLEEADTVFRAGGRYRDVFLQQQYLGEMELNLDKPYPEYQRFLQELEMKRLRQLQKTLAGSPLLQLLPSLQDVEEAVHPMSERGLFRSYQYQASELYDEFLLHLDLWAADHDPEHLHRARRFLKNLMYLLNLFGKSRVRIGPRFRSSLSMKRTEQAIGLWHDRMAALQHYMVYLKKSPPARRRTDDLWLLEKKMVSMEKKAMQKATQEARRVMGT